MLRVTALIANFLLFLPKAANAQMAWPALLLKTKIQALFSFWLLFFNFCVELFLMRILLRKEPFVKIAVTTIFMNQASSFVAMGVLLLLDSALAFFQRLYISYFIFPAVPSFTQEVVLNSVYMLCIYCASVFINAFVEEWIACLYFPQIERKKLFWYLVLVNAVSVGIGIVGLLMYERWFEVIKVRLTP